MQDLKQQFYSFDVATKQKFCLLVFGSNIVYTGESVRTPFLHPMFSFKNQDIQGFEHIGIIEKPPIGGSNFKEWTLWEDIRTLTELFEIFAA